MSGAPVTAVLDVGKTNVKVVLFECSEVLWQRGMPNTVLPGPPYPHAESRRSGAF